MKISCVRVKIFVLWDSKTGELSFCMLSHVTWLFHSEHSCFCVQHFRVWKISWLLTRRCPLDTFKLNILLKSFVEPTKPKQRTFLLPTFSRTAIWRFLLPERDDEKLIHTWGGVKTFQQSNLSISKTSFLWTLFADKPRLHRTHAVTVFVNLLLVQVYDNLLAQSVGVYCAFLLKCQHWISGTECNILRARLSQLDPVLRY
jgi:hypothetical protein